MSIKPKWVEKILQRNKFVELRRRGPSRKHVGSRAYIYASSPQSSIVAHCVIVEITVGTPEMLWGQIGSISGCTHKEFFDYFKDASNGTALHLGSVAELKGIPLSVLRKRFSWHPPVSWCQIADDSELALHLRPL